MHRIFAALALVALAVMVVVGKYDLQEHAHAASLPSYTGIQAAPSFASMPAVPDKEAQSVPVLTKEKKKAKVSPVRLSIPSIELNNSVIPMGINTKGELDVPSGSTHNIGWYAKGVVPGEIGSAVMDAHVFAAFSKLHEVKAGDDIYVVMNDGSRAHFIVSSTKVYELKDLSSNELFKRQGGRYLHLITCAGQETEDGSTYTHRLVVYAELAD
jgi:LPXTG-site transpeptidase (sortase) family protein